MMALDGFIDGGAAAEVVAGEDQVFQWVRLISPGGCPARKA
jgi:hypothetical protein